MICFQSSKMFVLFFIFHISIEHVLPLKLITQDSSFRTRKLLLFDLIILLLKLYPKEINLACVCVSEFFEG